MAEEGRITKSQIREFARAIDSNVMETVAEIVMRFSYADIKNCRTDSTGSENFNVAILRMWANEYTGRNQLEVGLLCFIDSIVAKYLKRF